MFLREKTGTDKVIMLTRMRESSEFNFYRKKNCETIENRAGVMYKVLTISTHAMLDKISML